ncbi:two-component system sensor histidine kinase NtrB [Amphibiibacter pelophylacis]|uniref:ATP-binding protein n=1 Tax=Amphibiibacter pelophylacis TaxID=1799477 RepID=A0ACC6P558_9BURK
MQAPETGLPAHSPAFDQMAVWLAWVDGEGQVRHANAALQSALGRSLRQLCGRPVQDWLVLGDEVLQAMDRIRREDFGHSHFEATLGGAAWLRPPTALMGEGVGPASRLRGLISRSDEGWCLLQMWPVARQQEQDEERQAREHQMAQHALFRALAHEIKNPLGGIRGAAQLMAMDFTALQDGSAALDSDMLKEWRSCARVVDDEVGRLQGLVDRLLTPQRAPRQQGWVNVHEVCEHVWRLVKAEYGEGLSWQRDYDVSLPELWSDHGRLVQVVLNLVQNAAQMLQPRRLAGDARITVRTRAVRQSTVVQSRHRLAIELTVSDNGPGVAPELQHTLFAPMVSGRSGGTGLGLTLAQTYAQQLGGSLKLEQAQPHAVFRVLLPVSGPAAQEDKGRA